MKYSKVILIAFIAILLWYPGHAYSIPAFPGAEGFGANSVGGRGGKVIKVTNLNDSGSGSFRAAVEASGPRIVVFEVSGIINLQADLNITKPYITIAGQTSPGGILIAGKRSLINTHDVIVQHVRFRTGSHSIDNPETQRVLYIAGNGMYYPNEAYNVIIDHCSFSWAADQVLSVGEGATNVIIQWSIISEGLDKASHPDGNHSYGLFFWGKYSPNAKYSVHHNYLAHNGGRNPEINYGGFLDAVNNVVYNYYGSKTPKTAGDAKANWIHNYVKPGLDSNSPDNHYEVRHDTGGTVSRNIYTFGNVGVKRKDQSNPIQWYVGIGYTASLLPETWKSLSEIEPSVVTKTVMTEGYAAEILKTVGASKPFRDTVDERVVNDFATGSGRIRDDVSYPDDFPIFQNLPAPEDNDNDGMADSWETRRRLNVDINDSALDQDNDGYTNIEEYLHSLTITAPAPPSNLIAN